MHIWDLWQHTNETANLNITKLPLLSPFALFCSGPQKWCHPQTEQFDSTSAHNCDSAACSICKLVLCVCSIGWRQARNCLKLRSIMLFSCPVNVCWSCDLKRKVHSCLLNLSCPKQLVLLPSPWQLASWRSMHSQVTCRNAQEWGHVCTTHGAHWSRAWWVPRMISSVIRTIKWQAKTATGQGAN